MRPSLNILSDDLVARILAEAKRIMSETGIEVRGIRLRERLLEHGLKLDATEKRILFPPDVVDKAIASCPRTITLCNRKGEPHAELGGDRVNFVPGSSALKVADHRTGETRRIRPEFRGKRKMA